MRSRAPHGWHPVARAPSLLLLLAVVAALVETWCLRGLFWGLEVSGGSMAPTLVGEHREVACADCGHVFACGADGRQSVGRAVCPNCDFARNPLDGLPVVAGDRVLLNPAVYRLRPPERWELAAFRHPEDSRQVCVKRVVGLPGEAVQIRDGEVYIDGRLARKPLERQRAVAVLVFDADSTPSRQSDLPPRWQSEPAGAWGSSGGRFAHAWINNVRQARIDWLTYCHSQRGPGDGGGSLEGPITNRCGYNQHRSTHPANVHPVRDVMLSFRLARAFGKGKLFVRANDGRAEFVVGIDPAGQSCKLLRNGAVVASRGGLSFQQPGLLVEVSLVDCRFTLATNGRQLLSYEFEPPEGPTGPTSRPLAIGSQGLGVEVQDLRIYRDVYYTQPPGIQGRWGLDEPAVMGDCEFFLLGDNSLTSFDSRQWLQSPGAPAALLLGKPILAARPAGWVEWGGLRFQVPDPAEIRYIQ